MKKHFFPITPDEIDENEICGNEYVYPNKYQLIPCLSFTVLRKDHYILYNDENLNDDECSEFMNEILTISEVNVYSKSNIDDSVDLIRKKKYVAVKLITCAVSDLSSRDLIIQSRQIIGSNFVCLVFSPTENNIDWISKMENVLLTTDYEDVKKFASLKMNINDLLAFIQDLKNKYEKNGFHFSINEKELLLFPKCIEKCQYYQSYYDSNNDGVVKTFFKKIFSFFG